MRPRLSPSLLALLSCALLPACPSPANDEGEDEVDTSESESGETTGSGTDTGSETATDTGTGTETTTDTGSETDSTTGVEEVVPFPEATKGGPIAVSPGGSRLAVVNAGSGELTLFGLPDLAEQARIPLGGEPESLAFSPTGDALYVVLRANGTVVRIDDLDDNPTVGASVEVGAEPGRAAMSSTGSTLWVPLWAEGYVVGVDTATMTVTSEIETGGSPYAVCVTNDLDEDEADETIFVTDFYGVPVDGAKEATDGAREGRVFTISAADESLAEISLPVLANSGTTGFETTGAYPNQLYSCAINQGHLYVTSVGASPASFNGATDFHQNLQGLVHRVPLDTLESPPPVDLNALVDDLAMPPKRFVPVPVDIDFANNSEFAYIASLASDAVLRVDFSQDPAVAGSPSGANFLATGNSPMGVAIAGTELFAANEVGRSIAHIDLAQQLTIEPNVESATLPDTQAGLDALTGQRFFNTGLGRWSTNGWCSCVGCHPFGTTDNVTWSFPAGPRQTVDTAASFDEGGVEQRIFNWTAIFDEVHDFELNTRLVAGGTGAIVTDAALNANGTANAAVRIDIVGPGGTANPINAFNLGSSRGAALTGATPDDWDEIAAYVATIRSPHGTTRPTGDVLAGRDVFEEAGCQRCHGGPLWTLSRRTYTPAFNPNDGSDQDERLLSLLDVGIANVGQIRADQLTSTNTDVLTVLSNDANGAPARHTCVARIVGTFDADGPGGRGADELRQNATPAQGPSGYNVPSLLGIGRGAPFLHNGAAETLDELLDPNGEFVTHLRAGNQVFAPTDQQLADLIAFVASIDDTTDTFPIDAQQDICPANVPQQN